MILLKHLRVANFKILREVELRFPQDGSILIEGLNESGKSTLFEAVYFALFGRPLVATMDTTIRYGAQESFVELALMVDATEIVIGRSIRARGANKAQLTVCRPGEPPEVVTRISSVNERIVKELGLDGETLLNSCFVEQKKLERLQNLSAQARRDSLLRLLNLETLGDLETQFKPTRQDDQGIEIAGQRRDLAQVQVDIPTRTADLVRTDRRTAARRIMIAVDQIDQHRREIAGLVVRHGELLDDQHHLRDRLERIALMTQTEGQAARLTQVLLRRQAQAAGEETARHAVAEAVRDRDEKLPALLSHLAQVQDLARQGERLEAADAGIAALREGAAAWVATVAAAQRASQLHEHSETLGERLRLAIAMREALNRIDSLAIRGGQLEQTAVTIVGLGQQQAALVEREQSLPAFRSRMRFLLDAAERLAHAETAVVDRTREHDLALAFQEAVHEADRVRAEHNHAVRSLDLLTPQLQVAERHLQEARNRRTQPEAPMLRAWIAAMSNMERVKTAQRDEAELSTDVSRAELACRTAEASVSAASARALLILGGAAIGVVAALVVLFVLGMPLISVIVLILSVVAGASGVRYRGTRRVLEAVSDRSRSALVDAQQRLADVRAVIGVGAKDIHQRLTESESMLRATGRPVPADVADAQMWVDRVHDEEEREAQQALERERLAQSEVSRLNQNHGVAEMRMNQARADLETKEQQLEQARTSVNVDLEMSALETVAVAQECLQEARAQLAAAQERASALQTEATPQRLQLVAAGLEQSIRDISSQVEALPALAVRLDEEQRRAADLQRSIESDRRALEAQVAAFKIDTVVGDLASLRRQVQKRAEGLDEDELRHTQSRVTAEMGGARTSAEQQRQRGIECGRRARQHAGQVASAGEDGLASLGHDIAMFAALVEMGSGDPAEIDRLEVLATEVRNRLKSLAAGLNEPLDLQRLRSAAAELSLERRQLEARIANLPEMEEMHARLSATLDETDNEIASAWSEVDERLRQLDIATSRDAAALRSHLQNEIVSLDEPSARTAYGNVIAEVAGVESVIRQREDQIVQEEQGIGQDLASVNLAAMGTDRATLGSVLPEIYDAALPDLEALRLEREHLVDTISQLRSVQRQIETALDIAGVELELQETEAELDRLVRLRQVKQHATQIITTTRTRMINRVLPGTEQNLRLLLPDLTAQRYHDAKLNINYQLEVWDSAAQSYVAKEIFSGGTRDQFSLALRLAFALATLPQELGATPGFIFLDEPLSAFDLPRTAALVELLTRGQIRRSFAQIFLVSHSRSFDPSLFDSYLRMDDGRVAETNLPRPLPRQP